MLTTLLESNARRTRRPLGLAMSAIVHAVMIAVAVTATAWTAPAPTRPTPVHVIYTQPPPAATPEHQPHVARAGRSQPTLVLATPVPAPVIAVPIDVPTTLPPSFDGDAVLRAPSFGTPSIAVGRNDGPVGSGGTGDVHTVNTVEKPVMAMPGSAAPRYPDLLRRAGVEGSVRARFVVDTVGAVERGSLAIVTSDHALFGQAVRDALARARYLPAEAGGHRVRQLVEQTFTFTLARR